MLAKKTYLYLLSSVLFFLVLSFLTSAQDNQNESHDNSLLPDSTSPIIDSIDYGENLLDSNEMYKKLYENLSEDGEWITASKAQFIREVTAETGENLDSYYPENGEVIYVWRPYCATPSWNPYTNGRWTFCNYGWTWVSNYNWGWCQYNYGRWFWSYMYGWVWIPGRAWAVNWVNWRCHNNYVGWYPTCPRIFWTYHNRVYRNHLYTYYPKNWEFVNKKDFTKKIDITTIIKPEKNPDILKNSDKVKIATYVDPGAVKFKYTGPDVNDISKETKQKILPVKIDIINPFTKQFAEVNNNSAKKETGTEPVKENVSKPVPADVDSKKAVKEDSNTKTEPVKNTVPVSPGTKDNNTGQTPETKQNERAPESKPEKKTERTRETKTEKRNDEPKENKIEKGNEGSEKINYDNKIERNSNYYIERINELRNESNTGNTGKGSSENNPEESEEVSQEKNNPRTKKSKQYGK